MAPARGRRSEGKKIDIKYIENRDKRLVTFSKRRGGLFKKASELGLLCGARVAVVVFSSAGKSFGLGDPSVDAVLRLYAPLPGEEAAAAAAGLEDGFDAAAYRAEVEATLRRAEEAWARVKAEEARMDAIGKKVVQVAGERYWWEADVEQLGEAELTELARALQRLRDNVQRRADKLRAVAPAPLPLQ